MQTTGTSERKFPRPNHTVQYGRSGVHLAQPFEVRTLGVVNSSPYGKSLPPLNKCTRPPLERELFLTRDTLQIYDVPHHPSDLGRSQLSDRHLVAFHSLEDLVAHVHILPETMRNVREETQYE